MKVFKFLLIIASVFLMMTSVSIACEGPECEDVWQDMPDIIGGCPGPDCESAWVSGENNLFQNQDFNEQPDSMGGTWTNSGDQCLGAWGEVRVYGGATGEYNSMANQALDLEVSNAIPGGSAFNEHQAIQQESIDLVGNSGAVVNGANHFDGKVSVSAGVWQDGAEQQSANTNDLSMTGGLCVWGGEATYASEVINQNGHSQELTIPGGTMSSNSFSGQRGFMSLSGSDTP